MLTMRREYERADTAGPYPKSLLYFVHHSFEDPDETPILGLEENLTADAEISNLFSAAPNEIVYSVTSATASKRGATRAVHHGDHHVDARRIYCRLPDLLHVRRVRLAARCAVERALIRRVHVRRGRSELGGAGIDALKDRVHVERPALGLDRGLGGAGELRKPRIREAHGLESPELIRRRWQTVGAHARLAEDGV